MSESLVVNEIYLSVQGESTWAGLPCVFIRLTACNLRCSYCDTAYAFTEGGRKSVDDICARVDELAGPFENAGSQRLPLIELTGGEPLLQKSSIGMMTRFCDSGYTVLLETSGAHDVAAVDGRVHKIMDSLGKSESSVVAG
jgi:7-carboxy-7-deazaguanine synthase